MRLTGLFYPVLLSLAGLLAGLGCSPSAASMRVDSIRPTRVPAQTGAQLLISGQGFRPGVQVSVGGVINPRAVWVNETVLAVALPPWLPPGPYDVLLTD